MPIHPDTVAIMLDTNPPQATPFYGAIGYAITTWQQVERALCSVFVKVSTCREEQVATAIFYTYQDFSEKLKLVHCAARLTLSASTEFNEWEKLRKRLITSMELRNALAHFHVAWQIPGAAQNGTPGPTVEFAILQVSETGATIPRDSSWVGPHPHGVHLLLRSNLADPNEKFKGTKPATKKPMKILDILNVQKRFHLLIQDIEAFSAKIHHPGMPTKE